MSAVLVTGGSRGIGRAICLAFARGGSDVYFCYSADESGAEETLKLLRDTGVGAQAFRCDVTKEDQVLEMFGQTMGIDVLVNNAGISRFGLIQDTSLQEWNDVFSVNMVGAFLCTRAAIPKFVRRGGGCVINISSIWGETGASCEAAYSASKAALIGFTKAAAKELAPSGIRVNCVAAGMISTRMNGQLSEEERKSFVSAQPIAREGTAEEVASAVYFLSRQKYVTGEVLRVNGGALI